MRIADSRVAGLLPLQHQGFRDNSPPWDLDKRCSIFGIRILDRFDKANQAGHWKYDSESVGDIHGGQLFKKEDKKREVPMWRFATGVVVTYPAGNPPVATPGNNRAPVATPGGSGSNANAPVATPSSGRNFYSPGNQAGASNGPPGEGARTVGGEAPGGTPGSGVMNGTVPTAEGMGLNLTYSPGTTSSTPGALSYSPDTVTGANPLSTPGGPLGPVDRNNRFAAGVADIPTEPEGGTATGQNPINAAGGGPATCKPIMGGFEVSPILDENYGPDLRLQKLKPYILKQAGQSMMPRAAIGSLGITLTANEENKQIDLFFPTDNRLIAINFGGDVRCGSLVCDLTADSAFDPDRMARLQALAWVIKRPSGNANSLAWNIGPTGCGDTEGGYVIDDPDGGGGGGDAGAPPVATPSGGGSGRPPVATPGGSSGPGQTQVAPGVGSTPTEPNGGPAAMPGKGGKSKVVCWSSRHHNGPLDVGTGRCRHWTGDMDDDGHPITPLHIQWQFLLRENDAHDGPLNITRWKPGKDFDQIATVYMGWNPLIKKWDWWTTVPMYYCPTPTPYNPLTPNTLTPSVPFKPGQIDVPSNTVTTPSGGGSTKVPLAPVGTPSNPVRVTGTALDLGSLFGTGTVSTGGDINKPDPPGTTGGTTGGSSTPGGSGGGDSGGAPAAPPTGGDAPPNPKPGDIIGYTTSGIPIRQPPAGQTIPPMNLSPAGGLGGSMSTAPINSFNVPFLMTSSPVGSMMDLAKPVNYSPGKTNPANNTTNAAMSDALGSPAQDAAVAGPVTGSMVAFGGEGGNTGSGGYQSNTGAQGDPWVFTQMPGASRFPSGTGPGGWCILPPEVDMQYARTQGLVPPPNSGLRSSVVYFITGPGAWFGAGVPELGNGTMKDGYIWGFDSTTGDLVWKTHSNSQAAIEAMRFVLASQNFQWRSGTSFYGEFDHANTANRVYTFPDKSGTVALTSDVLSGITAYKSADQSITSSTVLTDDTALTVNLAASTKYRFRLIVFFTSVGAGGIKVALNGTAGVTSLKAQIVDWYATGLNALGRVTAFGSSISSTASAITGCSVIEGTIEVSTAGTFKLQWAQVASDVSATTVQQNSYIECAVVG